MVRKKRNRVVCWNCGRDRLELRGVRAYYDMVFPLDARGLPCDGQRAYAGWQCDGAYVVCAHCGAEDRDGEFVRIIAHRQLDGFVPMVVRAE